MPEKDWLIQASYNITDSQTMEREVNALVKAANFLKAQKLQIVTRNDERVIQRNELTIEVVPIWKWLTEIQL